VSYKDIRVVVQYTVSTFEEYLEEYLYCIWPTGNVNVQWVGLC